ncbi:UDP-2-acetamido-3-amino-2, 3-dideoxy-D-glucuronate N-acetyltransferase [Neolewinella maritima]|uniref:UDP-2-acetamido-3-amino-2, 3-dideoxy-D-glucuronate N-acetyltransferase n=1 Tax=Neolewinella maritima TaxID=1383882 RepID=A0ABM9AYS4_9BACT|nr:acyltransferase [Neolewinella maritima]CAH0999660.1 UDP-2-acetamido-3-amino-2, 3-dideoxy-D-glucuronate N-acetyltransferase [Neolewinella maritima]
MDYYVHPTAVVDEGAQIGRGTKVWHFCHLMACELGADCSLGQNVFVASGVRVGRGTKVQNNVSLYAGLDVGEEVFIGPSAVFTNVRNPRAGINRRGAYTTTIVGRGVTIGANATIVCGITLHAYAFVGAGAVVTRDVPAYALVVGTPARQQGWMSRAGHRLEFDAAGVAVCPESGTYRLEDGAVVPV